MDSLKKKMKEEQEHTFAGIDSRTFVLWKVCDCTYSELMQRSDILEAI